MKEVSASLLAHAIGIALMSGCVGFECTRSESPWAAGPGVALAPEEPRAGSPADSPGPSPPAVPGAEAATSVPPVVTPSAHAPLDLKSLEARLRETQAISVFTKLALKNQIEDLLERFRAFHQGRLHTSWMELRQSFDMLMMKTLALLQDADASLAGALASSRESLWGILSDPAKLATV